MRRLLTITLFILSYSVYSQGVLPLKAGTVRHTPIGGGDTTLLIFTDSGYVIESTKKIYLKDSLNTIELTSLAPESDSILMHRDSNFVWIDVDDSALTTSINIKPAFDGAGTYQHSINIGDAANIGGTGKSGITMGNLAGAFSSGDYKVILGEEAGQNATANNQISIGYGSGWTNVGANSIQIGVASGYNNGGKSQIAIGTNVGVNNLGDSSIFIGANLGRDNDVDRAIFIGIGDSTEALIYGVNADTNGNDGKLIVNGVLEVDGDSTIMKGSVAQFHRMDSINTSTADAWINIKWDTLIDSETTTGYIFNADSTGFIMNFSGISRVQGCAHWLWTGADVSTIRIYTRVLVDGVEARCLQTNDTRGSKTSDNGIVPFIGTIYHNVGEEVNVQYRVSSSDMDFEGDAVFDTPVSFSVNFEKLSNN